MNDRELLEQAAKAAGYEIDVSFYPEASGAWWIQLVQERRRVWNPLTDDGDAFRLAVRLGLFWSPEFARFLSLEWFASQEWDDCYAHRRAIVRAAAAKARQES